MKEPHHQNFEPPPLSGGEIWVKTCFFFEKFAVALYSTDFLETCKNDGPHGDAPSVIFSEFLSWFNKGKIRKHSRYRARSLVFVNFTFVPPTQKF